MTKQILCNFIHSAMYVIGSQVYEDEEINDSDEYYVSSSVYETHADEYIYEDDIDLLSMAYYDKMNVSS
jgi:hypothetical protein